LAKAQIDYVRDGPADPGTDAIDDRVAKAPSSAPAAPPQRTLR
jgi:hypothetical protein